MSCIRLPKLKYINGVESSHKGKLHTYFIDLETTNSLKHPILNVSTRNVSFFSLAVLFYVFTPDGSRSINWNTNFKPTKIGLFAKVLQSSDNRSDRIELALMCMCVCWHCSPPLTLASSMRVPHSTLVRKIPKLIYILHCHLFTSNRNQNVMFNNNMSLNCKWIDTDTIGETWKKCEFFFRSIDGIAGRGFEVDWTDFVFMLSAEVVLDSIFVETKFQIIHWKLIPLENDH